MSRRVTYPAAAAARARELHAATWEVGAIRRIIGREFGRTPQHETVRCWVDEEFAERRRRSFAEQKRKERRERGVTWLPQMANLDTKLHRIRVLHEAGVPCVHIATVMRLDYGIELTEHQVRNHIKNGVVPRTMRSAA